MSEKPPSSSPKSPPTLASTARLAELVTGKVISLPSRSNLRQAALALSDQPDAALLLVDADQQPLGLLTQGDLIGLLAAGVGPEMRVQTNGSLRLGSFPVACPASSALEAARQEGYTHLLSVDGQGLGLGFIDISTLSQRLQQPPIESPSPDKLTAIQTLLASIPEPAWLKSETGLHLACNGAYAALLGLPMTEILGKSDAELLGEELAARFQCSDLKVIETNAPVLGEDQVRLGDGRMGLFETIKSPMRDEHGHLLGVFGIARDVTEHRQCAELAKAAEIKFQSLVEQSLVAIYIIQDGEFRYVNQGFAEMFGYDHPEEIIEQFPVETLVHPEDRAEVNSRIRARLTGDLQELRYQFRGLRKNGVRVDVEAHGRGLEYEGRPAVIGICLDITERKQAERQEKARGDLLDALIRRETLAEIFTRLVYSLEGLVNDTYCSILLYEDADKSLHLGSAPHLPAFYNQAIEGLIIGPGVGSCGTAVYEKKLIICDNLQTHPYWTPFKAITAQAGLGSCWSEPILDSQGKVFGTFAIYSASPRMPTPEELDALSWAVQLARLAFERRAIEDRLAESEAHFRALADSGHALVWTSGLDRKRNYVNGPWLIFTGQSWDQVKNEGWVSAVHPDDRDRFLGVYSESFEQRLPFRLDYRLRRHDGVYRWMQVDAAPYTDRLGQFAGYIGHCLDISERKQAEESLKESEIRFRTLFESSNDALMLTNHAGIADCNQACLDLFRCPTRQDFLGKHPADFSPPLQPNGGDSLSLAQARIEEAFREQRALFEWRHRRLDGEEFTSEVLLSPVEVNGEPMLHAVVRDVTERKRAEAEVRKLAQAVEQSPEAVIITDNRGMIEYVNAAFCQITGYQRLEVLGKRTDFLHPETTPIETFKEIADILKQGIPWKGEFWNVRKDGSEYLNFAQITPIHQADGTVTHFVAVEEDITAKKKLAEELDRYRHHLEELVKDRTEELELAHRQLGETFDAMSRAGIAVFWMDFNDGRLLEVNDYASLLLGYSREELLEMSVPEIDPHFQLSQFHEIMALLVTEKRLCVETVNIHKDGHPIPIEVTLYMPESEEIQLKRVVAFITDISLRKQSEQALIDAKQLAESASRAKSEFLANMSHEIRTPMNAILGLSQLLEQRGLPVMELELVGKIRSAGDSLLAIINEILDFSKIEAGRLQIESAPFQLSKLLEKISTLGSTAIAQKPIEFVIGPAPEGIEYLRGDALRLEQVLVNLVGNAAKFTSEGEIKLEIAVSKVWSHHCELRFSLSDTGIGIEPELLQTIFNPFSQADSSTSRRFGGTGLGLSICQRLVKLMQGDIGVDSTVGQGSRFWFTVQLEMAEATAELKALPTARKALVVDDHPDAREVLASIAESLGWEVVSEPDGRSAIEQFSAAQQHQQPFDLVLMDWQMPEVDGLQASLEISKLAGVDKPPIIVMVTAYEQEQLLAKPHTACVDAFISKPVTASTLYDTVVNLSKPSPAPTRELLEQRLLGWNILVTDDNEINRDVAQLSLEVEGAKVFLAENGQEAVDWLNAHPALIDVVLMDVQMPVMDGYEATLLIRLNPAHRHLPIVALSAGVFKEQRDAAIMAGMDSFIAKPFDPDEMVKLLLDLRAKKVQVKAESQASKPTQPVFDVEKALKLWRKPERFKENLRIFVSSYSADVTVIKQQLAGGQTDAAKATAHRLKGVAGNLALLGLHHLAGLVEAQLREGAVAASLLEDLQRAMDAATLAVNQYLAAEGGKVKEALFDQEDIRILLEALLAALDLYSPDDAAPLLEALADSIPQESLSPIAQAVAEFEFAQAKALILRLAESLRIAIPNSD